MKKRIFKTILSVLLGLGIALLLSTPILAAQQKVIKVLKTDKVVSGADVDAPVWMEATVQEVSLTTAPPVHPAVSGTPAIPKLMVQAVQDKENLYIRLKWQDGSNNAQIKGLKDFRDAVAVQFPINMSKGKGKAANPVNIMMGEKGKGVRIWRWAADNIVENLSAEGFGTLSPSDSQYLKGVGRYKDGGWTVVLYRSLTAPTADEITFGRTFPVAFAVWDGGNGERDGFKAVTLEWIKMQF